MRLPYGSKTVPIEEFTFEEASTHRFVEISLGQRRLLPRPAHHQRLQPLQMVRGDPRRRGRQQARRPAFARLPPPPRATSFGIARLEVAITDRRETSSTTSASSRWCTARAPISRVLRRRRTTQKPAVYDLPEATANARLSAMVPYMLAAPRFAHYLKVICRDKIGPSPPRTPCRATCNRWIGNYVQRRDDAGQDLKASYAAASKRGSTSPRWPAGPALYQGGGFPAAALPARRADHLDPPGRLPAAAGGLIAVALQTEIYTEIRRGNRICTSSSTASPAAARRHEHVRSEIEVLSWNHGFSQPTSPTRSTAGAGTVEQANHS